jgi:hypothetical protein
MEMLHSSQPLRYQQGCQQEVPRHPCLSGTPNASLLSQRYIHMPSVTLTLTLITCECVLDRRQGNRAKGEHKPTTGAKKQNYVMAMHHQIIPKGRLTETRLRSCSTSAPAESATTQDSQCNPYSNGTQQPSECVVYLISRLGIIAVDLAEQVGTQQYP